MTPEPWDKGVYTIQMVPRYQFLIMSPNSSLRPMYTLQGRFSTTTANTDWDSLLRSHTHICMLRGEPVSSARPEQAVDPVQSHRRRKPTPLWIYRMQNGAGWP